jgi:hypothetical protein
MPTDANFYKVEKWSRDGLRVELMLYAGNNLDKARRIFERTPKHHRASGSPSASECGCWTSGRDTKRYSEAAPRGGADCGQHCEAAGAIGPPATLTP